MIAVQQQVKTTRVDSRLNHELAEAIDAAFDWWREAGVDCDFHEAPTSWLAPPEPAKGPDAISTALSPAQPNAARPAAAEVAEPPVFAADSLPAGLAAFADWWMAEPMLDGGRTGGRVLPRGPVGAPLMVLVPHPEDGDQDAQLLSGPQGRLLDAMLAAMGVSPGSAYVASVLPRHTPHADWSALKTQGFAAIVARHVTLAAPQRLIVFGGTILPLLGNDPAQNADILPMFNHEGTDIPLLAERGLDALLQKPAWKARFWKRWLDWTV